MQRRTPGARQRFWHCRSGHARPAYPLHHDPGLRIAGSDLRGGYYQGIGLSGDTIPNVTGYSLANSYKEVGRMATFPRTFKACNLALGNRYADAIAPMKQSVVDSYYRDGHGWHRTRPACSTQRRAMKGAQHMLPAASTQHRTPGSKTMKRIIPVVLATMLGCLLFVTQTQAQFVGTRGPQFVYQGSSITFYGSTFYPSTIGGTSAWHSTSFPSYIDQMIGLAQQGGERPSSLRFLLQKQAGPGSVRIGGLGQHGLCDFGSKRQRNVCGHGCLRLSLALGI